MTENYCYRSSIGTEVSHDDAVVDFVQTRRFNDHDAYEGSYNLVYMCRGCGRNRIQEEVTLLDRPEIDQKLKENYAIEKDEINTFGRNKIVP